ncbi:MAG: choice-of-anchor D domain-containing protein [Ignavibacteria bacterium]|nr:choice-of-anchor D domain-containing protein [Ignavibacteria bacterium]
MYRQEIIEGREFWFGVPLCWLDQQYSEGLRGEGPICVWISSRTDTKGYLEDVLTGSRRNFVVRANQITQIVFGDVLMHKPDDNEMVANKGIYIKAEDPVSVAVYISYAWTGEAYRVIPVEWLGKRYVTANLYLDKVGSAQLRPPQILIVATENNTTIRYRPSAPTPLLDAGQLSQPIRLNKGQTFFILGRMQDGWVQTDQSDLTGTYIEANKPIAVISGHTKGAFPRYQYTFLGRNGSFMRNMMIEMIWPIEMLGNQYVSCPIKYADRPRGKIADDKGDMLRFIAAYDNTIVYQMRKDGSGLKQISKPLKRGEYHEITNQEEAAYYESTKPVLAAMYGKTWWLNAVSPRTSGGDDIQNPPRNGQGMMLILAPFKQWTSYASFRSPQNIDNFVAITFRAKDLPYLKFDGKTFTARFGNAINYIEGTEFAYIVEQVAAGDHWIMGDTLPGGKEKAVFAGYVYGNWDRSKDGFAYGYPIGVNYRIECEDSLVVNAEMLCGDITGEGIALPPNADCAGIHDVLLDKAKSYNYSNVQLNPDFKPGDKTVKFKVFLADRKQSGKAVVSVITRSGQTITREFVYEPELIAADPTFLDFGLMQVGDKNTLKFKVTNKGVVPATIKEFKLKFGKKEFDLSSNQLPATLEPNETREFEVTATALVLSNVPVRDSVIAVLTCYEETIVGLELRTGDPIVYITDAHWEPQPIGKETPRNVEIRNLGNVDIVITGYDFPDKVHFRVDEETLPIPLTLKPNNTHTFIVYYKADVPGVKHSTRCEFQLNATKIKTYSDWDGSGLDAGPTITGYDWKRRRVIDKFAGTDKYEGEVIIDAIGNAKVDVMSLTIEGDVDGVFSFDTKNAPLQLTPNSPVPLKVWFAPKAEKVYEADIVLLGRFSDKQLEVRGKLQGIGILPHIDIQGYTFPPIMVGNQIDGNANVLHVTINPITAMDLTVFSLRLEGPDRDAFIISNEYLNPSTPVVIPVGGSWQIPVTFKPTRPGNHIAYLVPESDAPDNVRGELIGEAYQIGVRTSDYDFGKIYKTTSKDGKVFITNIGSNNVTITKSIALSVSGDYNEISVQNLMLNDAQISDEPPILLRPKDTLWVLARFNPPEDKKYQMRIAYEFETESGEKGTVYSNLVGEGMVYKLICKIPKGVYVANPGDPVEVSVILEKHPDETKPLNDPAISEFKVKVTFDSDVNLKVQEVYPAVSGCNDIQTVGTISDGFKCEYAEIMENRLLQVLLKSNDKVLGNFGTLMRFRMNTFLSDLDLIPLPVEFQVANFPAANYVIVENQPGDIRINPVCVNTARLIEISTYQYFIADVAPNPIQNSATITYGIAFEGNTSITLWNPFGEKVTTLFEGNLKPGIYDLRFDANQLGLPSGVYYCKLESGSFTGFITISIAK